MASPLLRIPGPAPGRERGGAVTVPGNPPPPPFCALTGRGERGTVA